MAMTDLPLLGERLRAKTLEGLLTDGDSNENPWLPEGRKHQFNSKDNWGDGTVIRVGDYYMMTHRSGYPLTGTSLNGCQFQIKAADGIPSQYWNLITGPGPEHGLIKPYMAIQTSHFTNVTNIDTACMVHIPADDMWPEGYISLHGVKPGDIGEGSGEGGIRKTIQYWLWTGEGLPARESGNWVGPSGVRGPHLINGKDYPAAIWAQAYGEPASLDGGCDESSGFYDPELRKVVVFWEGNYVQGPAEWNGSTLRFAIGRAECEPDEMVDALNYATAQWTPEPSATSYVWRPKENGMKDGEVYGETNESAVWGTSEKVPLRSHVSRDPRTGYYHMLLLQKKPNTGGGKENRTSGIGHYWSDNYGKKGSWHADVNNPIVDWDSNGFPDNGQANKLNSPHILWDEPNDTGWVCYWGNGTTGGMNSPDTQLYMRSFPMSFPDRKRRRRGRVYRTRTREIIPLTLEEQKATGIIGIRPPHRRGGRRR